MITCIIEGVLAVRRRRCLLLIGPVVVGHRGGIAEHKGCRCLVVEKRCLSIVETKRETLCVHQNCVAAAEKRQGPAGRGTYP